MESLTPYQVDYEVTFVFLVVYAMCLCPVIYEVNSTRKLSDVYSLDMIMSEKGGSVVTRIPTLAIHPEMWSSMKHHLGGHPKL